MSANTSLSCLIPVQSLTASPYYLTWGMTVYAQVIAINVYGQSIVSVQGSGAIIITSPSAPLSLSENFSIRSNTTLGLQWFVGTSNGGSPVLDY